MYQKEATGELLAPILREIFKKRGIKYLITDLDDTLIDTSAHYKRYMWEFASNIGTKSGADTAEIRIFMDEILDGLRPIYKVNPMLMKETARFTVARYGLNFKSEAVQADTTKLMELYDTPPEVFDGVHGVLDNLSTSGLGLAVSTFSDEPWASSKLAKNGLYSYFRGNIFAFPSWGDKGIDELRTIYKTLGISPSEVMITGDSWNSDINPNILLGVPRENLFRISADYPHANQGRLDGITELERFTALPEILIARG